MDHTSTESDGEGELTRNAIGGSRVVAAARTVDSWVRQSFLYRLVADESESDTPTTPVAGAGGADDASASVRGVSNGSRVAAAGRAVTDGSRLVAMARGVSRWFRQSFLYRWLTKEPEPEVIVIDLRETYVVGPIIRALDWAVAWLAPRWQSSGLKRLSERVGATLARRPVRAFGIVLTVAAMTRFGLQVAGGDVSASATLLYLALLGFGVLAIRSDGSLSDLRETRLFRLAVAVLEPPEPPEERRDRQVDTEAETDTDTE